MTRKALLIGAQTNGLSGVLNDVEAMAQALEPRGFRVERLVTPAATRAGILDAYEKLIVDARPDDAFVVYYSGHGGRLQSPTGPDLQFIVPDDFHASPGADGFGGITGVELSVLLKRLTDGTPNATVILDCCHAAHMSRQTGRRVKALLRPTNYAVVEQHVARLPAYERPLISNPHAVRVVACAPSESAYESTNRDGTRMGLLTDALARALREAQGFRVNWSTLIDAVRRDVQTFEPAQRPEAEGPSGRPPFETTELEPLDSLPVVVTAPDRIQLLGAPLLGVAVGDEFAIMPSAAGGPQIGAATVDKLEPTAALAQLRFLAAQQSVPADARARRTHAAAPALPVRLPVDDTVSAELNAAMALRPLLRPAEPGEDVEVAVDVDDGLVVRDSLGPLHEPYSPTPLGISAIMSNLQRIAQATALRRLGGDPDRPLTHGVVVEWGRVGESLPLSGALLYAYAGERVFIRLRNDGDQAMYVSLVDIGVSSRIAVLTAADPGGIRLAPRATYTYGWNDDRRQLTGVTMTWPEGIDATAARPETMLALISDGPVDVSVLRQQGVRGLAAAGLGGLLAQIATGASRELGDAPTASVRYAVQPIDFTVSPTPPPTGERATFLIDDRPAEPIRLLAPRGAAPGKVAVRLTDLIVERSRELGSADIRVDTLVLTGGAVARAETMRFSNVYDGDRLPLDDVLIYHGPAVDSLDLAMWISRDTTGSPTLGALLGPSATPPAADATAVAGATAVLVNTADDRLTGAVGLYRTSLLAHEQYGLGRHVRHPPDYSFTFSVEAVGTSSENPF